MALARYFPVLDWGSRYSQATLVNDLVAAAIVTVMLIPQSLAYALLAGLPAEAGLYASILPLVAYAIFGTSRTLAVGPVAVVSLMTATAVGGVVGQGTAGFAEAALALAFLSGAILLLMGLLRLGFLANMLSHPVVSGFISASGIVIATGQLKHILGIRADGETLPELVSSLWAGVSNAVVPTVLIGTFSVLFLYWVRTGLKPLLIRLGVSTRPADLIAKAGPIAAVAASIGVVVLLELDKQGVKTVGDVPAGLPPLTLPSLDPGLLSSLFVPALLISVIGFVESVSVAQTLAAKRRQRIVPDQELIGLGAANLSAAFTGGYPVTGGFARSVVNFDAGAETPAAGAYTAIGIALASLLLTPLLRMLPIATLAATIIVAVLSLIDLKTPLTVWRYSRSDFSAMAATILATLLFGVEAGVLAGVALSLALLLWRSSRPHAAIVGRVPGTQHFRNVKRHEVITMPHLLTIRIDESLTYLNARWLEEFILEEVSTRPEIRHLILMCPAVNAIDASALESLEAINHRLADAGVLMHLSEVKGPVMDRLQRSHFLDGLTGEVFLSQELAFETLAVSTGEPSIKALADDPHLARGLI